MISRTSSQPSDRALRLIDAALDLRQAGEYTDALDQLHKAQDLAPDYALLQFLLGLTYRDVERFADAERKLRRAIELDPDLKDALQTLGLLLATQGRVTEAISYLKRHAGLVPGDPLTLRPLVMLMWQTGRAAEARAVLAETWQKAPSAEVGIIFGRFLIRAGDLDQAEQVLAATAEQTPGARTFVEWAYALALLERYADAVPVLQRALEYEPGFDRALRGLADCYIPMGQYAEALAVAEQALVLNQNHCRNWFAHANALLALSRLEEALASARHGAQCIPPDDPEAEPVYQELRLQEAEALYRLDRFDEAIAVLDALRRQYVTIARFPHLQATLLKNHGRPAEALRVLDETQRVDVSIDGSLVPLRYELLHQLARPAEAWAFVEPLLAQQTDQRTEILAAVGITLYMNRQVTAAEAVFSQLSAFRPEAGRFLMALGFIRTGQGDLPQAEKFFRQALELPDAETIAAIVQADLGYLFLISGDLDRAEACLIAAGAGDNAQGDALLRVAYWDGKHIVPDEVLHPSTFVPIQLAIAANWVTLSLARGQAVEAEALARQMIEGAPDSPLGYMAFGWVCHATDRSDEMQEAWTKAQMRAEDAQQQGVVARWLAEVPKCAT